MSKTSYPWKTEEVRLLPASVSDYVSDHHLVRFLSEAELQAEAECWLVAAANEAEAKTVQEEKDGTPPKYRGGGRLKTLPGEPKPKTQKNFTDSDSSIMKTGSRFAQAYNAQAAVDAKAWIIIAHGLSAMAGDQPDLILSLDAIEANLVAKPRQLSAGVDYCSEANLTELQARNVRGYIATGRAKHPADATQKRQGPLIDAMRSRLKRGGHRNRYRLPKQLPEPAFGQIKQARRFRQFLLRGIENIKHEWATLCAALNILKLARCA